MSALHSLERDETNGDETNNDAEDDNAESDDTENSDTPGKLSGKTVTVAVGEGATATFSARATDEEAAALCAAIGAHLDDRTRTAEQEEDEPETLDNWKLAGRLRARSRRDLPRECPRGQAWKLAGRCR